MIRSTLRRAVVLTATIAIVLPLTAAAQTVPAEQLSALTYRHIGVVGNRIASVSGVGGAPLTYYVGAAAGGLWKTEDGGMSWRPVFDDQDVHSVGALAVSRSDP